jgi:hypothetical protein
MAFSPSPTDPNVDNWTFFFLGGMPSPGSIPRGGIKDFKRPTGWDIKSGKGTSGATLTLKDQPPCKGSITLQIIGPGGFYALGQPTTDFSAWDTFVAGVLATPVTTQQAQGLAVYHPAFAAIGLTVVVVEHYTPLEHVGKGLYQTTIQLIEWSPPPAVSIVSTVSSEKPETETGAPPAQDPRITALQAQIAAASQAASP